MEMFAKLLYLDKNDGITNTRPTNGKRNSTAVATTVHRIIFRVFSADAYTASIFFSNSSIRRVNSWSSIFQNGITKMILFVQSNRNTYIFSHTFHKR